MLPSSFEHRGVFENMAVDRVEWKSRTYKDDSW